ncbi:MAG: tRNA (adenosine(37)-N6)-threonylcarbamoyltransferase complex transferase subunit TsaD, partial [Chthoniobacterales bacterium]
SGLKTSVRYLLPKTSEADRADLCAGFQEAVVDVLVHKAVQAAKECRRKLIAVSGGVGLNARLRERLTHAAESQGIGVLFAPNALCTDNAAMIAYVAALRAARGESSSLEADIFPSLRTSLFAAA